MTVEGLLNDCYFDTPTFCVMKIEPEDVEKLKKVIENQGFNLNKFEYNEKNVYTCHYRKNIYYVGFTYDEINKEIYLASGHDSFYVGKNRG